MAAIIGGIFFWLLGVVGDVADWLSALPGAGFGFLYFVVFEIASDATWALGLHVNGSDNAPETQRAACCGSSQPSPSR